MGRRGWIWAVSGSFALLLMACQGGAVVSTPSPEPMATTVVSPTPGLEPEATQAPGPSPTAVAAADAEREREYRVLTDEVINGIGQLTRIISGISISLAGMPEDAPEAESIVSAVKGSFELARDRLERTEPPPGYEELHETLLDALNFYIGASSALLPDGETGEANYKQFQELMLQGGKNAHSAIAASEELRRKRRQTP